MNFGEPGRATYGALHGLKSGIKDALIPQAMFEDLGLKYLGPVNGHDIAAMEEIFNRARALHEPVLIHVMTQKGRGYTPAEESCRSIPRSGEVPSGNGTSNRACTVCLDQCVRR